MICGSTAFFGGGEPFRQAMHAYLSNYRSKQLVPPGIPIPKTTEGISFASAFIHLGSNYLSQQTLAVKQGMSIRQATGEAMNEYVQQMESDKRTLTYDEFTTKWFDQRFGRDPLVRQITALTKQMQGVVVQKALDFWLTYPDTVTTSLLLFLRSLVLAQLYQIIYEKKFGEGEDEGEDDGVEIRAAMADGWFKLHADLFGKLCDRLEDSEN